MMVMAVVGFSGITLPSDMGVLLLLALAFIAAGITPIWMLPCCGMLLPGRCLLGLMTAFPAVPRKQDSDIFFIIYDISMSAVYAPVRFHCFRDQSGISAESHRHIIYISMFNILA